MVTREDYHSELLVSRTLDQKTGAVHLTVSATVLCSVQTRALLCHCLRSREKHDRLAKRLRKQHEW